MAISERSIIWRNPVSQCTEELLVNKPCNRNITSFRPSWLKIRFILFVYLCHAICCSQRPLGHRDESGSNSQVPIAIQAILIA